MWGSRRVGVAGHLDVGDRRRHGRPDPVAARSQPCSAPCRPASVSRTAWRAAAAATSTPARRRSRPSPALPLVRGQRRTPAGALADGQHADARRAAPLVGAGGQQRPSRSGTGACPIDGRARRRGAGRRSSGIRQRPRPTAASCRPRGWRTAGRRPARRPAPRRPCATPPGRPGRPGRRTDTVSPRRPAVGGGEAGVQHRRVLDRAVYDARAGPARGRAGAPSTPRWHGRSCPRSRTTPRRGDDRQRCGHLAGVVEQQPCLAALPVQAQRVGPAAVERGLEDLPAQPGAAAAAEAVSRKTRRHRSRSRLDLRPCTTRPYPPDLHRRRARLWSRVLPVPRSTCERRGEAPT